MKRIVLCLLFVIIPCLAPAFPAAAQSLYLPAAEVTRLLSNRTFTLIYTSEKRENDHIYFAPDGKYTLLFPPGKVRSSDKWNVEPATDDFCLRRALRSSGDTRYITKCGKVTLAGPNSLDLHDAEGKHIYTLQFLGNGNLLDQFVK